MATSNASICNKALIHLGVRGALITDLLADTHEEAEVMRAIFDSARDACLAAFPWPFATLRSNLVQIPTTVEPARDGWEYMYELPDDCLQEREVWETGTDPRNLRSDQRVPFLVEKASMSDARVLLCDLATVTLRYTAEMTDADSFHPTFVEALACLLAAEAAPSLSGKEAKEATWRQRYLMKLQEAAAAALNGQREDPPPLPEAIQARS